MILDKAFTDELTQYSANLSSLIAKVNALEKECWNVYQQWSEDYINTPEYQAAEQCCGALRTVRSLLQSANQKLNQVAKSEWSDYVLKQKNKESD